MIFIWIMLSNCKETKSEKSDLESNREVLKSLKTVKVYSKDPNNVEPSDLGNDKAFDKRPKKENEEYNLDGEIVFDAVYQKYGYVNPERLRPGKLTLEQFDQFINGYKKDKSIEFIKQFSEGSKIDVATLHVFLEHYKAFSKIDGRTPENKVEPLKLDSVFPNVK